MRATIRFAAGVTHSLYPPRDAPLENPRKQQERLGDAATIEPGGTAAADDRLARAARPTACP